ncbi:MAG: ATP-dependent metallopeptidase FtsH/Yme1/Tma family protein [Alphaproteobacteria bacterium]|nr:ATP-dependent zinc metalloprotease FtsH [Alphaproteobacteria bacterium]TAD91424.1 MAG: ATP-dependent metallopeptidase FtsH/Yme1/Tma family protein [Alphaproteobacteria bacterium]
MVLLPGLGCRDVNNFGKNIAVWVIILLLLAALFQVFRDTGGRGSARQLAFSEFLTAVESDRVTEVVISGPNISGRYTDGSNFATYAPHDPGLVQRLRERNVRIAAQPMDDGMNSILGVLISWFPMLLMIGVWIFFMRQIQGGGGKAMGFGKSRARLLTEKVGRVTFDDVAGIDEAKVELQEIVEFLKDPQKFQRLGGKIPKGCLLVGPPGTGKTLLARAIAGEANVPFFTISGSDFVEMFVGVGASRVRDMFEQGKKNAPCIIFIDEIDAVGRHRGAGLGGGNDEREQTLNQLLVEMDGFEANDGVILIAATNRPDVLDPALLRPGRFDRQVVVANPDVGGREKILKVHMRKVPLAPDVDARVIARGTPGFSGADLANLVNEAALLAARRGKRVVGMYDFEAAKDKVLMGAERRSMVMSEKEKELTAYHEAGHALVTINMEGSDPLHKVTIIPRGRALGVTMSLPEKDRYGYSKQEIEARLAMMFGGRIAEEIIFGAEKVTTGASDDIRQATNLARRMVTEWGMSEKLGRLRYSENEEEVFLGHSVTQRKNVSDATARIIDEEIRRIIDEAEGEARRILTEKLDDLHTVAKGLLEYETLSGDEVKALLRGEAIHRDTDNTDQKPQAPTGGRRSTVPNVGDGLFPQPKPGMGD